MTYFALANVTDSGSFIDGMKYVYEKAPERFSMILSQGEIIKPNGGDAWWDLPGLAVLIGGMWVANLYYWGFNQYIIQRTLAAKSLAEGQKGIVFAASLKLIIPVIVVLPGIIAYVMNIDDSGMLTTASVDPGFIGAAGNFANDNAAPWLIKNFIPVGVKGLILAALAAAIVSSLASMLNSTSTIFTMDIYKSHFNKNASDLTIGESAMLDGLLPSPANYSPLRNLNKAIGRRSLVLKLMYNQDFITYQDYMEHNSIIPDNIYYEIPKGKAPYFAEHVRRILEQQDEQLGINIYQDGLKIHTTLDFRLQKIAEDSVMQTLKKNQDEFNRQLFADSDKFSQLGYLSIFSADSVKMMLDGQAELYEQLRKELLVQCAFIALDTKTGEILAMIGGRSDYPDEFNRSTQALRQPGSVFKPYIYTAAIDNNYPLTTELLNQPVALYRNNSKGEREKWTPKNYDNSTGGLTTLREGLQRSLNLISVRMVQELVPPRQVKDIAQRMQINSPIRAVDSIALGTSEVKPIEIVASYATFANKGIYSTPIAITRIEDKYGRIIKEYSVNQKEVLSPETAYMVTNLLQSVVDKGTGGSLRWKYKFRHPAGGKTGTTQNLSDAWFVGFTPNITAGVWYGIDEYSVSLGDGQYGGVAALPAWAIFMKNAHKELNIPKDKFEMPDGVVEIEIDSDTKKLPTSRTRNIEKEFFLRSNVPQ